MQVFELPGNKKRAAKSAARQSSAWYCGVLVQMDPVTQLGLLYCWHLTPLPQPNRSTLGERLRLGQKNARSETQMFRNVYLVFDIHKAHEVVSLSEDRCQLHSVTWLRCVVEVAVTRVNTVVAVVVEHNDVTGDCILRLDFFGQL